MEIDTFRSTRSTTNQLISPQPTTTQDFTSAPPSPDSSYPSIEIASDPLEQWVVFSPQESLQSLEEPITLPSMPSHDGSGHFFTSTRSSSSQFSDQSFSYIDHSPPRALSNASLSEIHSEDDELLSIPSSISANLTSSRRSSASASNYQMSHTNHSLTAEDSELLLTPMAISAGLTEPNQTRLNMSSLSSHCSSGEVGVRNKRQDARQRDPSRTSLSSRVKPPPLSLSSNSSPSYRPHQPLPPATILPDQLNIHQQKNHSPQMLNFLSNVAYKFLDIHPDTLYLFSSSHHLQIQNPTLNLRGNQTNKNKKTSGVKRFMIGDGDTERMRIEEGQDDEIPSPLDLSGFKPPITSQQYYEDQVISSTFSPSSEGVDSTRVIYRTDSCETFRPRYQSTEKLERNKYLKKSLSEDHFNSSPTVDHSNLNVTRSFSEDDDHQSCQPIHHSSSSIAGILLRKVWNEWTNWEV